MLTSLIAFYHYYISIQTCYALKLDILVDRTTLVEATRKKLVEGIMAVRSAPLQTISLKLSYERAKRILDIIIYSTYCSTRSTDQCGHCLVNSCRLRRPYPLPSETNRA